MLVWIAVALCTQTNAPRAGKVTHNRADECRSHWRRSVSEICSPSEGGERGEDKGSRELC